MRVDDELCAMLRRYHPLFINTHFNHPKELTPLARAACERWPTPAFRSATRPCCCAA